MILSHVVYDGQFSFVTICKVGKCMMPSVLKICFKTLIKSCVVYSSLKARSTLSGAAQNGQCMTSKYCESHSKA